MAAEHFAFTDADFADPTKVGKSLVGLAELARNNSAQMEHDVERLGSDAIIKINKELSGTGVDRAFPQTFSNQPGNGFVLEQVQRRTRALVRAGELGNAATSTRRPRRGPDGKWGLVG